jgi:hypothetical protein
MRESSVEWVARHIAWIPDPDDYHGDFVYCDGVRWGASGDYFGAYGGEAVPEEFGCYEVADILEAAAGRRTAASIAPVAGAADADDPWMWSAYRLSFRKWRRSKHRVSVLHDRCRGRIIDVQSLLQRPTPHVRDQEILLPAVQVRRLLEACPDEVVSVRRDHHRTGVHFVGDTWHGAIGPIVNRDAPPPRRRR